MQNEVVGVFSSVILYHTIQTLCHARIFCMIWNDKRLFCGTRRHGLN